MEYTWNSVRSIVDKHRPAIPEFTKNVYNNNLPSAVRDLLVELLVDDHIDRYREDVDILIAALRQLKTEGKIG